MYFSSFYSSLVIPPDPPDTHLQAVAPERDFHLKPLLDLRFIENAVEWTWRGQGVVFGFNRIDPAMNSTEFDDGLCKIVPAGDTLI